MFSASRPTPAPKTLSYVALMGRSPGEGKVYPLQYSGGEYWNLWGRIPYSPWGCKGSDKTERFHFHFIFTGSSFVLTHFAFTVFAQCLEHGMHLIDV